MTPEERFNKFLGESDSNDCIPWIGVKTRVGYGHFWLDGKYRLAHRVIWTWRMGAIPEDHHIDHICKNPLCMNVQHLRVTPSWYSSWEGSDRNRRKTHCSNGHEFNKFNTFQYGNVRHCGICIAERSRRYRREKRENARQETK